MIARPLSQARLPIAAIAALALLAFVAFAAVRPTVAPQALTVSSSTPASTTQTLVQKQIPATDVSCAVDVAYVTGDMVGDASPAEILANLCKR